MAPGKVHSPILAYLELANGQIFYGWSFGYAQSVAGEAVFQTGMVGYTEALTDPSYSRQLLVLTYPSIGNYGVPNAHAALTPHSDGQQHASAQLPPRPFESYKIHVAALVVADYTDKYSHWAASQSLAHWLHNQKVPAIAGVDTRAITQIIRDNGTMLARIVVLRDGQHPSLQLSNNTLSINGENNSSDPTATSTTPENTLFLPQPPPFVDPNTENLVAGVVLSDAQRREQNQRFFQGSAAEDPAAPRILVIDCGIKYNQLRILLAHKTASVTVVPWDYDFIPEDSAAHFDGIFVSNGPGDPKIAKVTIQNLRKAMNTRANRPIFGICLGHQLLALAAGFSTYKLKYGNRGHNQPCIEIATGRCFITSQNHGYAVTASAEDTPVGWVPTYVNANDGTNEGIAHHTLPFFSVQFHPEACAGPHDTEFLFDLFTNSARQCRMGSVIPPLPIAARRSIRARSLSASHLSQPRKVIVLGSGGLSIGQAGEFDYSGSQAIKALKEEGIRTVLINPNIATVQTSPGLADKVYFLAVTPENVVKVAEFEKPDGILLTFGGQTALNCGVALHKTGSLQRLGIRVLGTPIEAILDTEDRDRFNARLSEIGEPFAPSRACNSVESALAAAAEVGYPVILRAAFALGGLGSGFANNEKELQTLAVKALAVSSQVLVERSMKGWKEIEYEVVRDANDNCITVCNMENFDPLGIHTGDSIVVAPSQTLSDAEYHMLRNCAIRTVRHLKIVGECNIQYALNPKSMEYCIIEVNARLSRSSALASKATGYPLAFVAAKLALGKSLSDIRNSITQETTACFEPSLDYLVVKMPRWDLKKFTKVSRLLGSSMKSVGEVMAIGRTFEECFQKAIRMVRDNYVAGFESGIVSYSDNEMLNPTEDRPLAIASGFAAGLSVDHIHELTKIDKWFLHKLERIISFEQSMSKSQDLEASDLIRAKELGFSDRHIAKLLRITELSVRKIRQQLNLMPRVKQIDTVAAEFPAKTNYLYVTYASLSSKYQGLLLHSGRMDQRPQMNGVEGNIGQIFNGYRFPNEGSDVAFDGSGVMVLGSGAYRIGSSVEFDWCAVSAIRTLRSQGFQSVMVNYNPETVSTDYDECDRLYFDELSLERVLDIYDMEKASGIIVSMGGQLPNNIAMQLHRQNARILGTTPEMIDGAENRYKFSRMLDRIGVDQPRWKELSSLADAKVFCSSVGYPVLVRPSFVLSGAAMNVVHKAEDLEEYLTEASAVSPDSPVVISKFILEAKEIEVDAVARKGELVMHVVSEHVENAGVHSGDATLVLPPQDLDELTVRKVEAATAKVALALNVTGPLNIQFIAKNNEIKVIECNLRASRSFPFVSKTIGLDIAKLATKVMLEKSVKPYPVDVNKLPYVGVKVAMFSFTRLLGADPILGVEMASTGEVACFGATREEAYYKGLVATHRTPPKQTVGVSIGSYKEKLEFLASAKTLLSIGMKIIATPGTADFFQEHGVPAEVAVWSNPDEYSESEGKNTIDKMLSDGRVEFFINIPSNNSYRRLKSFESAGYTSRRTAVDFNVPLLTNIKCAKMFVKAMAYYHRIDGRVVLSPHDSRFSSRVITLPGMVLLDATVDAEDAASHVGAWKAATEAAVRGGFSTVCVSTGSIGSMEEFAAEVQLADKQALCNYLVYASAQPGNAGIIKPLARHVAGLKICPSDSGFTSDVGISTWMEHFQSWPEQCLLSIESCGSSLAALLFGAVVYNRNMHVCRVSSRVDVMLVKACKQRGLSVTCDVNVLDLFNPPGSKKIPEVDQEALWEHIDIIDAVTGPPDLILPLLLSSVHEGRLTMEWVTSRLVSGPRRILGLPSMERIPSVVEVDLDEVWQTAAASVLPGVKCRGRVRRVAVGDSVAYLDGKVWSAPGSGRNIRSDKVTNSGLESELVLEPQLKSPAISQSRQIVPKGDDRVLVGEVVTRSSIFEDKYGDEPTANNEVCLVGRHEESVRMKQLVPTVASHTSAATPELKSKKTQVMICGQVTGTSGSIVGPQLQMKSGFKEILPGYGTGWWAGRHVLSVSQFSREELHSLFAVAQEMRSMVSRVGHFDLLRGKVMAALFFEPSTRTSLSFQAAMQRLGGTCVSIQDAAQSSSVKGETLGDTVRTLDCYTDITVIRHPSQGSALEAASKSSHPVINAGDGVGEHPTQAILDVFTIREELGTVNGLTVTFVGDLKHGRTVHSLALLLSLYSVRFHYVAPSELGVPSEVLEVVAGRGVEQYEHALLEDSVIQQTDVLYMTRMQRERFENEEDYERLKHRYVVTPKTLTRAKESMIIMHPLPRVGEISPDVDSDPRAVYFRQMEHGMYVRMALLAMVLGKA